MSATGICQFFQLGKGEGLVSLPEFLRRQRWVVNLAEYEADPDAYDGLALPEWVPDGRRLWLIVPLFHAEVLLGFVMLARPRVPEQLNWETLDLLKTAARQAASYLALEQAARVLADARQFMGFNRLSAFIVHDLKNLIAQLSLGARNAERHKHNPDFIEDAIVTVRNSVDKMNRLLAQLRSAMSGECSERVDLSETLREVVAERAAVEPAPRLEVRDPERCALYADRDRLAAVVGHAVRNAQEATLCDGTVSVRPCAQEGKGLIEVEDTGVGMDDTFVRERLCKPFDSTKGLAGMGLGGCECREFIRALGGRVEVQSAPGRGIRFLMIVPLEEPAG